ncbi:hypothetical protein ISN45_Aa03g027050 [Arabidopsis thaliana x Arabidopsis arenosa]|uniref:Uncharacterized protein n=1 Tax=Arabidopsis thaliana x Arabidopsis arenosa TaxID=1240361 RepID=A0A8T2AW77_9BRAS|nr:hypothetical protein ISN45_Aa03g027050 [Arabidopsis thaliana x Arabidopsis arenosa]
MDRYWRRDPRRPMMQYDFLNEMEYSGSSMPMQMEIDDDDFEPMELFEGGGFLSPPKKLDYTIFFHKFEDDFDDSDIN